MKKLLSKFSSILLILKRYLSNSLRGLWHSSSLNPSYKRAIKNTLFQYFPILFSKTQAYQSWAIFEGHNLVTNRNNNKSIAGNTLEENLSYSVSLFEGQPLKDPLVKLIAFYLPQFHSIPENNEWWGDGFTEWTNVRPAQAQFSGHYQPHLPGELGYYDLTDSSVQKRQVELAKLYGVGGFCFYFYWFAGKKLLESPILNYLNDPSLDLPFCLCWANENWSRRWDGLENNLLIKQDHSPEDDLAFIQYISQYLRDPRYIRIDNKPLIIVYRPGLLPSPKETAERWRSWCRNNGIGEIYIAYTQSFEIVDPKKYGFNAAVEFPPNNSSPPIVTDNIKNAKSAFSGMIYDWNIFLEKSKNYSQSNYTLFRGVNPSWDNTARRKTDGTIFVNSTPKKYGQWLCNAINDTLIHHNKSEQLIFVNAWNEWAEGAHLEPDEKYGYAYLQETRNALSSATGLVADSEKVKTHRILLVAHDAHPHGAQYLILNMAKVLHEMMGYHVDMIVLGSGILMSEYEKYATIHDLTGHQPQSKKMLNIIQSLYKKGAALAITNTAVTGLIVPLLKQCDFTIVSLIHELPQLIKSYHLQEHVKNIAEGADKIVFATTQVKEGFETFVRLDKKKILIRPQGLYKKNSLQTSEQIKEAKIKLRERFSLPKDAKIVLGVGFADYRKGIDIFIEAGLELLKNEKNVFFLWLGKFDPQMEKKVQQRIKKSVYYDNFVFPGFDYNSDIYFAGADIYALTSREDPFPSVIMEALDVMTPVVAFSDSGGAIELLSKGNGLLVEEMNSYEFSKALMNLIKNPEKIEQMAQNGKKIIDSEFSFEQYLYELISCTQVSVNQGAVNASNI